MRRTIFLALLVSAGSAFALPPQSVDRIEHFILVPQHPLQPQEVVDLQAKGVTIGRALGGNRFMARVRDRAAVAGDLRIQSLEPYVWTRKIARGAYAEAAKGKAFGRFRVVFHDEVALDQARQAVADAGGAIESPLAPDWLLPNTLVVRYPAAELQRLASDERVFGVYGPPLRVKANNAVAAGLSHVTPLFSAPYNLSGDGITLSLFELGPAEGTHIQFQGRYDTSRVADCGSSSGCTGNKLHATHTAGTMISAGVEDQRDSRAPQSKGMAPKAHLVEFSVIDDFANIVSEKDKDLKTLGSVADNNSWDFTLGWSFESPNWVWNGDFFGAYGDPTYQSPYEAVTIKPASALFVHSAGNDADQGSPTLSGTFQAHLHCCDNSGNTITNETFCYSPSGSGTDCSAPCSPGKSSVTGEQHCETTHHPIYGPYKTIGLEASLKNVVTVGAMDAQGLIAGFSSRGPTLDGRLKPELVAKGVSQLSTIPGGQYAARSGTSMSGPVVTGISALLTEQWRKTFGGQNPSAAILKTLLIAGADDGVGVAGIDTPGPDYTYGFGLADAKASADLIIADAGTGSHIKTGTVHNGDTVELPLTVASTQNLRVVLGWFDPDIAAPPDDALDGPALLNDLDVKVIDPSGTTVLPYVLDKEHPSQPATHGVNTVDTTEMVEIPNAAAGQYRVVVTAKLGDPTHNPAQDFVVVSNGALVAAAVCGDNFEPNDTQGAAYKFLPSGQSIAARTCSATDVDFYDIDVLKAGPLSVSVISTDTPLRVTLSGNGITPIVVDVPAGSERVLSTNATTGIYDVEVQPNGTVGPGNAYTLTATFSQLAGPKHRATRR
jgi:hypothetical protein